MKAQITVNYSEWLADGECFPAGSQEIEVSREFAPILAAAVSAGAVSLEDPSERLLELLDGHVESQEDSEAKLVEAMGEWVPPAVRPDGTMEPGFWSGPWTEGHLANAELAASATASFDVDIDVREER